MFLSVDTLAKTLLLLEAKGKGKGKTKTGTMSLGQHELGFWWLDECLGPGGVK